MVTLIKTEIAIIIDNPVRALSYTAPDIERGLTWEFVKLLKRFSNQGGQR